jgi:hypothetical protein
MILIRYVHVVNFNDSVAFLEASRLGRRIHVYFANMLALLGSFGMQIKAIALKVRPLFQMT